MSPAAGRGFRRVLLLIGVGLAVLFAAAFAWDRWTIHQLAGAHARIAAASLPSTIAELAPAAVPPHANAAPRITELDQLLKSPAYAYEAEHGISQRLKRLQQAHAPYVLDSAAAAEFSAVLDEAAAQQAVTLVRHAADLPAFNADVDYAKGAALLIPHVTPLREAANLLRAHIRVAASQNRAAEACRDLERIVRLSEFLAPEPTPISQLTRVSLANSAMETAEQLAGAGLLTDDAARGLAELFGSLRYQAGAVRALDGERALFGTPAFELVLSNPAGIAALLGMEPDAARIFSSTPRGFIRLEFADYLERIARQREITASHWDQPLEHQQLSQALAADIPRHRLLLKMVMPTVGTVALKSILCETKTRAVQAGLAVYRYRLRHGRAPETLAQLVPDFLPAVPRDPFAGRELTLVSDHQALGVHSVGSNGHDDSGEFAPPRKDDLAFWLVRRPGRPDVPASGRL